MTRLTLAVLAAFAMGGASAAVVDAAMPPSAPQPERTARGCLAISQGVCFSGSTQWVAGAAGTSHAPSTMLAMAGDEY